MIQNQTNNQIGEKQKRTAKTLLFSIVGLSITLPILGIGLIYSILYFALTSTREFKCAMSEINKNKEAVELLGSPIENGYLIIPNIEISGARRDVQIQATVSGSKSGGWMTLMSFSDAFSSNFAVGLGADGEELLIYKGIFPCG